MHLSLWESAPLLLPKSPTFKQEVANCLPIALYSFLFQPTDAALTSSNHVCVCFFIMLFLKNCSDSIGFPGPSQSISIYLLTNTHPVLWSSTNAGLILISSLWPFFPPWAWNTLSPPGSLLWLTVSSPFSECQLHFYSNGLALSCCVITLHGSSLPN